MTAGVVGAAPGRLLTEEDNVPATAARFSEQAALAFASSGVRVSVVRLSPSVPGEGDHGFVPSLITIAREKGVSAYPSDGANRWPAVHRLDAARLFRLALESALAGARLHGVANEGVPAHEIAGVIARRLNLPVVALPVSQADEYFGWLGRFFSLDLPASRALPQQQFGWHPVKPGLLADFDHDYYFNS